MADEFGEHGYTYLKRPKLREHAILETKRVLQTKLLGGHHY